MSLTMDKEQFGQWLQKERENRGWSQSDLAQLKAVSQNSMHASIVTTDQIYGKLVNDDVLDIISSL